MNSVRVEIFGSEYRIRGDADPESIQEIAHYVDSKMREVSTETSLSSSLKVAILAALNIAGELFRVVLLLVLFKNLLDYIRYLFVLVDTAVCRSG